MAYVWIISNNLKILSRLFGHLKLFIRFKCPNANTYDLIQKSKNDLENCAPFLSEVLDQGKDDEHFRRAFQVHGKGF